MLPCPFKFLTGLSCPGCGSQRALWALLHGHPLEAWAYNWLLPPLVLYALVLLVLPRTSRLYQVLMSPAALLALAAVIASWWVLRNILCI